MTTKSIRFAISAAMAVFAGVAGSQAHAIGPRSKMACLGDYRAYCSTYTVGSSELRHCMRQNGTKLSRGCIDALIADGEISKAEVARRSASMR